MSRAHGKHTGRKPELTPEQAAEYGIETDRDIPGGATHLVNRQALQQKVPVPDPLDPFRGMMAHGVPPAEHGITDRDHPGGQRQQHVRYAELPSRPTPIPVVVVDEGAGARPLRMTTTANYQLPAAGGEPVLLCGQDERRHALYLLNEGTAGTGVRVGNLQDLTWDAANSVYTGGALLPKSMTSFQKLEGQSQLYAISADSSTPRLSVIIETSVPGAA